MLKWETTTLNINMLSKEVEVDHGKTKVMLQAHQAFVEELEAAGDAIRQLLVEEAKVINTHQRLPHAFAVALNAELGRVKVATLHDLCNAIFAKDVTPVLETLEHERVNKKLTDQIAALEAQMRATAAVAKALSVAAPAQNVAKKPHQTGMAQAPAAKQDGRPQTSGAAKVDTLVVVLLGPFPDTDAGWDAYKTACDLHLWWYPGTHIGTDMPHPILPGTKQVGTGECWWCGNGPHPADCRTGVRTCTNAQVPKHEFKYCMAVGKAKQAAHNLALVQDVDGALMLDNEAGKGKAVGGGPRGASGPPVRKQTSPRRSRPALRGGWGAGQCNRLTPSANSGVTMGDVSQFHADAVNAAKSAALHIAPSVRGPSRLM
jgi:hypothetical protein